MCIRDRPLAERLQRSAEDVPAAHNRLAGCLQRYEDVLPLEMMAVFRAAERLPVQTTLHLQLVLARPAERLALQARLQLFPAETHTLQ